ncbi:MAG: nucleoid-associated protein YejK [Vibrionaceae bacterium]
MSLSLSHLIIHQLKKTADGELVVQLREQQLEHSAATAEFVSQLHQIYMSKEAKGFGHFTAESEFANLLTRMRQGALDFLSFSTIATAKLKDELCKYPFADEGTLVLAQYRALASEYLFIGLLDCKSSMKLTADLDLSSTDYLDLPTMSIAACIDLCSWESGAGSNRYLTYIKGRVGRKVADFFLDFMQAEVGLDPKAQNTLLVQAVEEYCTQAQFSNEEKQQCRQQLHDYASTQLKAGEELKIETLAQTLAPSPAGDFAQFAKEQSYDLEESFPADRAVVRKLTKFVGSGGGVSINFDSLLLGERIAYDPQTDTLTLKGTPPNLRDQLKRYLEQQ